LFFLELLPMNYAVSLKKAPHIVEEILKIIIQIASEETDNQNQYEDTP